MTPRTALLFACLALSGCQALGLPAPSLPRTGFETDPEPVLPVSVAYAFDASVTDARIDTRACGLPYTLNAGEIIPQAFLAVGRERFQSVSAYAGDGDAVRAAQSPDLTVHINLVSHSLQDVDRIAEEDNYLVFLNLQLQAVFLDRNGTELARIPLRFNEQMTVWTPALTGHSVSCVTGQYDDTVGSAARNLAEHLADVVPELLPQGAPAAAPAVAAAPATTVVTARPAAPVTPQGVTPTTPPAAASTIPPVIPQAAPQVVTPPPTAAPPPLRAAPVTGPTLTFRTRLKDANENLILEAGETLVLEIETTHTGARPLMAARADLTGSDVLVKAFSDVTSLPVGLGEFQPGETKTTEIRGRLPLTVNEPTGELIISLTPAGGSAPVGTHRILAPLRAEAPAAQTSADSAQAAGASAGPPGLETSPGENYVAVLIGMDAYRDDWPDAYHVPAGRMKTVGERLRSTGAFTEPNIRVLEGRHAAKSDIEEALFTWGRERLDANSVLLVYFSGQAVKNPTSGEVYLVPHEGSPDASANRLISLRTLQRALDTFDNRLTLLLLDAPLIPLNHPADNSGGDESRLVRWDGGLSDNTSLVQLRHVPDDGDDAAGGAAAAADVFAGLIAGAGDRRDVTVGDFLESAARVSEVTHALPVSSPLLDIPLTRHTTAAGVGNAATPDALPSAPAAAVAPVATATPEVAPTPAPTMPDTDIDADANADIDPAPAPTESTVAPAPTPAPTMPDTDLAATPAAAEPTESTAAPPATPPAGEPSADKLLAEETVAEPAVEPVVEPAPTTAVVEPSSDLPPTEETVVETDVNEPATPDDSLPGPAAPTAKPAPTPPATPVPDSPPAGETVTEPVTEPVIEPVVEPVVESTTTPAAEPSPDTPTAEETVVEPVAEPVVEPVVEPAPDSPPAGEPLAEPAAEPTAEPVVEPGVTNPATPENPSMEN